MKQLMMTILLLCGMVAEAQVFSDEAVRDCQMVDSSAHTVTLIFAPDHIEMPFAADSIKQVYVFGSVTEYGDMWPGYQLEMVNEQGYYYHTFTYDELSRPGNSGQPEYMFEVYLTDDSTMYYILPDTVGTYAIDRRRIFVNGDAWIMVTYPDGADYFTTDLDELYARNKVAQYVRPVSDYDLTDSVDQHRICNFRLTPGTTCLYRSYHPYYPDQPQYDTEIERLYWVAELARRVGIRSDITLSSNQERAVGDSVAPAGGDTIIVSIPDYHQALIDSGNILYVGAIRGGHPSTGQCYYHSDEQPFALWMKEVVEWIADDSHPLPIQMHCALGADRTGMFCATIACLCGVDWATIEADYFETSNMQIGCYRHPNRLRYALRRMTGLDPTKVTTAQLSAAVRAHFVHMGVLTDEQIDRMVARLRAVPLAIEATEVDAPTQWYDLMGRPTNGERGNVLVGCGKKKMIINE